MVERKVHLGDVILDWNASLLGVIRDWTTLSNDPYPNRIVPERPPVAARIWLWCIRPCIARWQTTIAQSTGVAGT